MPSASADHLAKRRERARKQYAEERARRAAGRKCVYCDGLIPIEFDIRRKTCSEECRRLHDNRVASDYYFRRTGRGDRDSPTAKAYRSESRRRTWAEGLTFKPRECRACGATFTPNSGPQRFCSDDCRRDNSLAKRYGVSLEEFRAIVARHNGRCAICGEKKRGWAKQRPLRKDALVVDHCHETGKIRGLLCGDCNTSLGRFGDDPARLRAAAEYLERC